MKKLKLRTEFFYNKYFIMQGGKNKSMRIKRNKKLIYSQYSVLMDTFRYKNSNKVTFT